MNSHLIDSWLLLKSMNDTSRLDDLLAEDAIFVSPATEVKQLGRRAAKLQISGLMKLFSSQEIVYVRKIVGTNDAMLEFESTIDGIKINGVEILKWNQELKITEVKVMLRPLDAANKMHKLTQQILIAMQQKR